MKKLKFIIVILIVVCLFSAVGCGSSGGNTSDKESEKQSQTDKTDNYEYKDGEYKLIKGFNDYYGCVATAFGNVFGRAEVNEDKEFITEGEGSMHLLVQGEYGKTNYYPNIRFGNDMFETDANFSIYSKVALDIYNDTEKELHMMLHLTVVDSIGADADIPTMIYTLPPHKWTTAVYDFTDGSVKLAFNNLQTVKELVIQFPEYKMLQSDECNSIYIDNFVGEIGSTQTYVPEIKGEQIMGFESMKEVNQLNSRNFVINYFYNNCLLSLNSDKRYVSQGNYSMKCTRFTDISTVLPFEMSYFDGISLTGYDTLSIDVYNASEIDTTVWLHYSTNSIDKKFTKIGLAGNAKGTITVDISGSDKFVALEIQFSAVSSKHELQTFYFDNLVRR